MNVVGALDERRIGVVPEHEADARLVPAIEVGTHRKVGIAPKQDVGEAGTPAKLDRLVQHG